MKADIADIKLASKGKKRILWADNDMPVLASIRERFAKEKPLAGKSVAACLHITAETANLARTLKAAGANIVLCAPTLSALRTTCRLRSSRISGYQCLQYAARTARPTTGTFTRHLTANRSLPSTTAQTLLPSCTPPALMTHTASWPRWRKLLPVSFAFAH